jgi:hypothetical protein
MIAWSRSLSQIHKELGFLAADEQFEDLIDVGDEGGVEWKVVKVLTYRWSRSSEGRWSYRLRYICLPDDSEGGDDG